MPVHGFGAAWLLFTSRQRPLQTSGSTAVTHFAALATVLEAGG